MPSKKKKYNARFPAGRIKKIMQSDEEIGKVAQAVPVIISRTLELFVESLLTKTLRITNSRNAKTLSTSHMKQCIMSEQRFDFLRELVKNIPDICVAEDEAAQSSPEEQYPDSDTPYDLSMPSTSTRVRNSFAPSNGGAGGGGGGGANIANNIFGLQGSNNGSSAANPVNYSKRNNTTASVIMHTTSVVNAASAVGSSSNNNNKEYLPPKLTRSESTPAQSSASSAPKPIWRPIETSPTTPRKRLKQQSESLPHYGSSNNIISSSKTPPKQQQQPAPIVNFDFCTKPIVKIDYSNLPMTTTTISSSAAASTAPLSAPVLGHHSNLNEAAVNKAFDFSAAAPIINIDLSNMMTAPAMQAQTVNGPAVATISIGALPLHLTPSSITASPAAAATLGMEHQSPLKASNIAATSATSVGSTKNNALLELDEDYDNI